MGTLNNRSRTRVGTQKGATQIQKQSWAAGWKTSMGPAPWGGLEVFGMFVVRRRAVWDPGFRVLGFGASGFVYRVLFPFRVPLVTAELSECFVGICGSGLRVSE